MGCCYSFGDGEVCGVGDANLATSSVLGLLCKHLVRELVFGLFDVMGLGRLFVRNGARHGSLENVLFRLGKMIKGFGGKAEVLGKDRFRSVSCEIVSF